MSPKPSLLFKCCYYGGVTMKVKSVLLGALLAMSVSSVANAAIYRWSFSTVTNQNFAFLDFDTATSDFRLFDNPLDSFLDSPLGVNGISFDFLDPTTVINNSAVTSGISIGTFVRNDTEPPLISGFTHGFVTDSNAVGDEVNNGESTTFNFGAIDFANIDNVAIRLNGNNGVIGANGGQVWIGGTLVQDTPVPEPETYAMFMAGLGLLGFVSRRKKSV